MLLSGRMECASAIRRAVDFVAVGSGSNVLGTIVRKPCVVRKKPTAGVLVARGGVDENL